MFGGMDTSSLMLGAYKGGNGSLTLAWLCSGYWFRECTYARNKVYDVKAILSDTFQGPNWVPEPLTKCSFVYKSVQYDIARCFRHSRCEKISSMLLLFASLVCEVCSCTTLELDFRKHRMYEESSLEKRGSHGALRGRRLGYFQVVEINTDRC